MADSRSPDTILRRPRLAITCASWALLFVLAIALSHYVWSCSERERNTQAVFVTCSLINEYVRTKNEWPRSWNDLQLACERRSHVFFNWPQDSASVKLRVDVKFPPDTAIVAGKSGCAVIPLGPIADSAIALIRATEESAQQHSRAISK
jgi:hypothetical protein